MTSSLPARPAAPGAWPLLRAMVGVGVLCGLFIVTVYVGTRPVIERKRAEAVERAIFQVLPEARASRSFRWTEAGRFEEVASRAAGGRRVHAGYDDAGRLVGLAVEAEGMGYQDVIRVIYGYSFANDAIIGLRVLESRETPGLGDKIETDPDFLANFERLDVRLAEDGSGLAHPIEAVKRGAKENPWEIDGITGATISSAAIARILRESAAGWVPLLRRHLDDFRAGE
jgi:electron transport complex protein RnfG